MTSKNTMNMVRSKVGLDDADKAAEMDPRIERENEIVEERLGLGEMPDKVLDDFGFAMNRLYDPCNYDHTTIETMVESYHFRDLEKSKIFRIAKKIFGDKMDPKFKTRTRTFTLSGLKTGCPGSAKKKSYKPPQMSIGDEGLRSDDEDEDLVDVNDLRLRQKRPEGVENQHTIKVTHDEVTPEALSEYDQWFEERKKLRKDLNSLGLNENWLRNKPDKTDMEMMLYRQLLEENYPQRMSKSEQEAEEKIKALLKQAEQAAAAALKVDSLPRIRRPTPLAIRKLDMFLKANKLRLIDIFKAIDKDKNWNLSREEFRKGVELHMADNRERYGMDISAPLLEDLISTFDGDQNGELSYKELVKGLELYQMEKRELKKKGLPINEEEPEEDTVDSLPPTPLQRSAASSRHPSGKKVTVDPEATAMSTPASRRQSRASSATTLLETPEVDIQESRLVMKSSEQQVDLRKRDRNFLTYQNKAAENRKLTSPLDKNRTPTPSRSQSHSKMAVFKTGYKPIDDHCRPSRLDSETGAMINDFRQLKLKEYYNIMKLCDEQGVILSRKLLDRVLLHPGDKPTRLMLKQGIRQPGANLPLSKHFADPPKRPRTPIEIRNRGKIKRGLDGELLIDYKHRFPSKASSAPHHTAVQLSTGKALISRKVDCWLTFEQYESLTKGFYKKRYVRMDPDTENSGLTWPGYMLDKMRIYLDHDRTAEPSNAIFRGVKYEARHYHGYDNDLNNWNISDNGYLTQGSLRAPKKFYDTSNLTPKVKPDLTYRNQHVHKNTAGLTMHTKQTQSTYHN